MKKLPLHSLSVLFVLSLVASSAYASAPAQAAGTTFRITVKSAYLRQQPLPDGLPTYSVFLGQVYSVIGRTENSDWLLLAVNSHANGSWIRATLGRLNGSLANVPSFTVDQPAANLPPATTVSSNSVAGPFGSNPVPVAYRVTVKSFFARSTPDTTGARVASLFSGQQYPVQGRTTDSRWLLLGTGAADAMWAEATYGSVTGDLASVAIVNSATNAAEASSSEAQPTGDHLKDLPPWIPAITPEMRQLYLDSANYGRDLRLITVAGDCNSEPAVYLRRPFDYVNSGYGWLEPTRNYFGLSFTHDTMAAHGGFGTNGVLDASFAPAFCSGQGVYECELERSKASVVFIMLGTTEDASWHKFADNYRYVVWLALNQHMLPVLVTKADSGESQWSDAPPQYMNGVVRQLALEYRVPLLDFWQAAQTLPNDGRKDDIHLDDAGQNLHLIATLETMYALRAQ